MNLENILKQFKLIEPDAAYKDHSKRALLASAEIASPWSVRRTLLQIVETGVAVALAGFFIFLVAGGFAGSGLSPVQYAAIDPAGIRAEARAIDIQIQLANVNYAPTAAESTPASAAPAPKRATPAKALPAAAVQNATGSAATSTALPTLSIDEALQKLSN